MGGYKVSAVTVCYNSEKTIEDTIKSVLKQTYDDYEYILIDGGSADGTVDIIRSYEKIFQGKMVWVSEKDDGIYDAMNKGIKKSSGDLICLLNSDDWFEPSAFQVMADHYKGEKYKIQYAMERVITDGKEEKCFICHHNFLNRRMIPHQTCFVTKAVYEDFGLFDLQYRSAADYDFMLRMAENRDVIFEPIYEIVANFRSGGMSESYLAWREQAQVKYKHGVIGRKSYYYLLFKAIFLSITGKLG